MKPSYSGFEAKKAGNFIDLPPVGAYVAEIQNVRLLEADGKNQQRDVIEMMIEITEGEYKTLQDTDFRKSDGVCRFYKTSDRVDPEIVAKIGKLNKAIKKRIERCNK